MQEERYSFIVRLWAETFDQNGQVAIWRGSIDRVGPGRRLYFEGFDNIGALIQKQMGLAASRASSAQKLRGEVKAGSGKGGSD